jgi:hypothetical protein
MRSPGGDTPDLISLSQGVSYYEVYADAICYNENRQVSTGQYYAISVARRNHKKYLLPLESFRERYHDHLVQEGQYNKEVAPAMGDAYVFAKFSNLKDSKLFIKQFLKESK